MFGLKMLLEAAKMFSPKLKEIGKSLEKIAEEAEKIKGQPTANSNSKTPTGESGPQSGDSKARRKARRLAAREEFARLEASDKGKSFPPLGDDHKPDNAMGVIWDVLNVRDEMMRELDKVVAQYPAVEKTYKLIQNSVNKGMSFSVIITLLCSLPISPRFLVVWSIIAQVVSVSISYRFESCVAHCFF